MIKTITWEDIESLLFGAAFYGCGGGGDLDAALRMLRARGVSEAQLTSLGASSSTVATVYEVGSVGSKPRGDPVTAIDVCLERLEALSSKRVSVLIPVELGATAIALTLVTASRRGLYVADCDRVGRAAPEIHQDLFAVNGIDPLPACVASTDLSMVALLLRGGVDEYEWLARGIASRFGSAIAVDGFKDSSSVVDSVAHYTLSKCIEVGHALRTGAGIDTVCQVSGALGALKARVVDVSLRDVGGFLEGHIVVDAEGDTYRLYVKNEVIAMLRERDGAPRALPPDLVTLLDESMKPVHTHSITAGQRLYILAIPCHRLWRTPRGLELFGPKRFGLDYEYVPIEELWEGV